MELREREREWLEGSLTLGGVQLANMPPCTRWYDEATGCGATAGLCGRAAPHVRGRHRAFKAPCATAHRRRDQPQGERLKEGR